MNKMQPFPLRLHFHKGDIDENQSNVFMSFTYVVTKLICDFKHYINLFYDSRCFLNFLSSQR